MEKKKKEYESGLYNGWAGLCWLVVFVPCFLYFVNHELFLRTSRINTNMAVVAQTGVFILPSDDPRLKDSPLLNDHPLLNDGPLMLIITDQGWFFSQERSFFDNIVEGLDNAEQIEIWYNADNRRIRNIRVNQSHFIIPGGRLVNGLYLFALILSGIGLFSGIGVIIKTKGWGSYSLLEKYPQGLLRTIFEQDK